MKINWHAIGGAFVSIFGTLVAISQTPAVQALVPPKYAAAVAILGALYAGQSGSAVTAPQTTPAGQ